jgi:ubiquinone/menaquinone biosynthesis C-methylase UbiE
MVVKLDPDQEETRAIHDLIDFTGLEIVELGCGDGRMTRRYADTAASVFAFDTAEPLVALAKGRQPPESKPTVTFKVADITEMELPLETFDLAVISWSL